MNIHEININANNKILIGKNIICKIGKIISENFINIKVAIITDKNVEKLFLSFVKESLSQCNINYTVIILKSGEKTKNFFTVKKIVDELLYKRLNRNDCIIALGGGVIGDISGFVSNIFLRGIHLIHIPTSLLSQVDSCIGGKTGINTDYGKNLIGTFYQANIAIIDIQALDTLPLRELRSGYAEIVKYSLITKGDFFSWLEKKWSSIFLGDFERFQAIVRSCECKISVIQEDEKEQGKRIFLNFGHTFGHAIEAAVGYNSEYISHGESIAIGIILAYELSEKMQLINPEITKRVRMHFQKVGLPTKIDRNINYMTNVEKLIEYLYHDKKVTSNNLHFILTRDIGSVFIDKNISVEKIRNFLQEKLNFKN